MFYKIWADAILWERKRYKKSRDWRFYTLFGMTMAMGCNYLTVIFLSNGFLDLKLGYAININIFPLYNLNRALSGLISFYAPFLIINYLLVFHRKKYLRIVRKYGYSGGRLYAFYVVSSILLACGTVLLLYFKSRPIAF